MSLPLVWIQEMLTKNNNNKTPLWLYWTDLNSSLEHFKTAKSGYHNYHNIPNPSVLLSNPGWDEGWVPLPGRLAVTWRSVQTLVLMVLYPGKYQDSRRLVSDCGCSSLQHVVVLTSLDPSPHCAPQFFWRRLTCTRGSRPARAFYLQYPLPVTVSTSQRRVACTPDYRHHTPTAATSIAAALPRRAGRCSGQAQCVMLHLMEWAGCTSNMFVISDFPSRSSSVSWNWKLKCPTTEPTELLWLHKMQRKRTNMYKYKVQEKRLCKKACVLVLKAERFKSTALLGNSNKPKGGPNC